MKHIVRWLSALLVIVCLIIPAPVSATEIRLDPVEKTFKKYEYPGVNAHPSSNEYKFAILQELIDKNDYFFDDIQHAKKRLSELMSWGRELPAAFSIKETNYPKETVSYLKKWWQSEQSSYLFLRFDSYSYWEAGLTRYIGYYENYLAKKGTSVDVTNRKLIALTELREDERKLIEYIEAVDIPTKERQYLRRLARHIFIYLYSQINLPIDTESRFTTYRLPSSVIGQSLNIDLYVTEQMPNEYDRSKIEIRDDQFNPTTILRSKKSTHGYRQFHTTKLSKNDVYITIQEPAIELPPLSEWSSTHVNEFIRYELTLQVLPEYKSLDQYFHLEYNGEVNLNLRIERVSYYPEQASLPDERLISASLDQTLLTSDRAHTARKIFTVNPREFTRNFRLAIQLPVNAPLSGAQSVQSTLTPIHDPEITILSSGLLNTASLAPRPPTRAIIAFVILLLIGAALYFGKFKHVTNSAVLSLLQFSQSLLIKLRFVMLGICILLFNIELRNTEQQYDILFIIIGITWLLFIFGSRFGPQINYVAALIFFVLSFQNKLQGNVLLSEKFAVWTYLFLLLGFLLSIIYRRLYSVKTMKELKTISLSLESVFSVKTLKGYKNFIILFTIICIILAVAQHLLFQFKYGAKQNLQELHGKPYITQVQPDKTTQAEQVTLYGYNLGWNKDGNSRLMSSDGEVNDAQWTNEQLTFTVPLHMNEGRRTIWVERSAQEDNPDSPIVTSNRVPLTIESRFTYYPTKEDNIVIRQYKKLLRLLVL